VTPLRANPNELKRIQILFEDDAVVCVAKPAGMAVHGGAAAKRTVIELLESAYPAKVRLHLVHRLDKDTSGVLLVAKSSEVARALGEAWTRYSKRYIAIVEGRLTEEQIIDTPLADDDGRLVSARTVVRPIDSGDTTLIVADISTGRTHQIRRHLAAIGHPILMDDKHGHFKANKVFADRVHGAGLPRPKHTLLHAASLAGPHPISGGTLRVAAEVPAAFRAVIGAAGLRVDALAQVF
jgi:23S rRNA pseudouridine955/2504/2580 synthase